MKVKDLVLLGKVESRTSVCLSETQSQSCKSKSLLDIVCDRSKVEAFEGFRQIFNIYHLHTPHVLKPYDEQCFNVKWKKMRHYAGICLVHNLQSHYITKHLVLTSLLQDWVIFILAPRRVAIKMLAKPHKAYEERDAYTVIIINPKKP